MTGRPPYAATAVRPAWGDLPTAVRAGIEVRAGARVTSTEVAGGGFTRGFAGLLRLHGGGSVFVKAAGPDLPVAPSSYRAEAAVLAVLPAAVPAPALRWTDEVDGWVVLGIEPVAGRMPGLPWIHADVTSAVRACEASATALTPPPDGLALSRLSVDMGSGDHPYLTWFAAVDDGLATTVPLSPWARRSLRDLQGLVDASSGAIDGDSPCHGDLRPDNLVVDAAGRTWICDWNWLTSAAPWTDLVGLLATIHADGHDADAVLRSSWLSDDAEDEAVDAWLSLIAAFMLAQVGDRPAFASPWLDVHRSYFGTAALSWLEARRTA